MNPLINSSRTNMKKSLEISKNGNGNEADEDEDEDEEEEEGEVVMTRSKYEAFTNTLSSLINQVNEYLQKYLNNIFFRYFF